MKSEIENNFYPYFKVFSINNNINPTVDILIESIDRFSFGEESDDDTAKKKSNGEEKINKSAPNNYSLMKTDNIEPDINAKEEDINITDIINNIFDITIINEINTNNRGKICGLFNKEDFDVKIEKKNNHKNNQLNDSFEKRYHNPLKNLLDEEDDDIPKISPINKDPSLQKTQKKDESNSNSNTILNNNKDENENKISSNNNDNKEKEDIKDLKIEEIKENTNTTNDNTNNNLNKNNNNNNLIDSNSNMKINNYDADDDKENEHKIKEINNPNNEIPFIGEFLLIKKGKKEKKRKIMKLKN